MAVVADGSSDDGDGDGGGGGGAATKLYGPGTAEDVAAATAELLECLASSSPMSSGSPSSSEASATLGESPSLETVCPGLLEKVLVPAM